jgi:hypothetical protein
MTGITERILSIAHNATIKTRAIASACAECSKWLLPSPEEVVAFSELVSIFYTMVIGTASCS